VITIRRIAAKSSIGNHKHTNGTRTFVSSERTLGQVDAKTRAAIEADLQSQRELEAALRRMEGIDVAALQYYSQFKEPPRNLHQLAPPTEGNAPTREASDLIPRSTGSGEVNGYRFHLRSHVNDELGCHDEFHRTATRGLAAHGIQD
jgi:hypothetical protein